MRSGSRGILRWHLELLAAETAAAVRERTGLRVPRLRVRVVGKDAAWVSRYWAAIHVGPSAREYEDMRDAVVLFPLQNHAARGICRTRSLDHQHWPLWRALVAHEICHVAAPTWADARKHGAGFIRTAAIVGAALGYPPPTSYHAARRWPLEGI